MLKSRLTIFVVIATFLLGGCVKDEYGNSRPLTDTEKGAILGAVIGAGVGATQKKKHGNKALVIGAVGGALAGGAVGHYMDSQKKDLQKRLAPEIQRGAVSVESLPDNQLRISMTSETAFDVDSTRIKTGFHQTLITIAKVLNKYGKTELLIVGHTDSTGSAQYNQQLSERRAQAVEQFLLSSNVIPQRLSTYGKGETQPIASNATDSGRRMNRRVEIIVVPLVQQ